MIIKEWKALYTVIIIPDWYFFLPFILLCTFIFKSFLRVVAMIASLKLWVHKLGGLTLFLDLLAFCRHQSASDAAGICPLWEGSAILQLLTHLPLLCMHTHYIQHEF